MSNSLIDQSKEINDLIERLDADSTDESLQDLLVLMLDKQAVKVDSYASVYHDAQSRIDAIDAQIELLKRFKSRFEKRQDNLKSAALFAMEMRNVTRLDGFLGHAIRLQESESVDVTALDRLPEKYIETTIQTKAKKDIIKKALRSGEQVEGAVLKRLKFVVID